MFVLPSNNKGMQFEFWALHKDICIDLVTHKNGRLPTEILSYVEERKFPTSLFDQVGTNEYPDSKCSPEVDNYMHAVRVGISI